MSWETLPEWVKLAITGSLSSLGTIVAGLFVAKSDSKRTRSEDRGLLTSQALDRLTHVEEQLVSTLDSLAHERRYCDERMDSLQQHYELKLKRRDESLRVLQEDVRKKEKTLSEAMSRIDHLEKSSPGGAL